MGIFNELEQVKNQAEETVKIKPWDGLESLPKGIQEAELYIKVPTPKVQQRLTQAATVYKMVPVTGSKRKQQVADFDPLRAIKFHVYHVIVDWSYEPNGNKVPYNNEAKEMLYEALANNDVMFDAYYTAFEEARDNHDRKSQGDKKDFLKDSETTPNDG